MGKHPAHKAYLGLALLAQSTAHRPERGQLRPLNTLGNASVKNDNSIEKSSLNNFISEMMNF